MNENEMRLARYLCEDRFTPVDEIIEESVASKLIPPLIVLATLFGGVKADTLKDVLKNNKTIEQVNHINKKAQDQISLELNNIGKEGAKITNDISEFMKTIDSDFDKLVHKIQNQKFLVVTNKNLDAPIKIDMKNKKIIVKDWQTIKEDKLIKELIRNGNLIFKKAEEEIKAIPKAIPKIEPIEPVKPIPSKEKVNLGVEI